MANLTIVINDSGGTQIARASVHLTAEYEEEYNRTKVTFSDASVNAGGSQGNLKTARVSITVAAKDNPTSTKTASANKTGLAQSYVSLSPSPETVYVEHGADAGDKYITVSANVNVTTSKASGSKSGSDEVYSGLRYGQVNIDTVDGWKKCMVYIDTADGWKPFIPYIDTADGWKIVN